MFFPISQVLVVPYWLLQKTEIGGITPVHVIFCVFMTLSGFSPGDQIQLYDCKPWSQDDTLYSKPDCTTTPSRGGIRTTWNNFFLFHFSAACTLSLEFERRLLTTPGVSGLCCHWQSPADFMSSQHKKSTNKHKRNAHGVQKSEYESPTLSVILVGQLLRYVTFSKYHKASALLHRS